MTHGRHDQQPQPSGNKIAERNALPHADISGLDQAAANNAMAYVIVKTGNVWTYSLVYSPNVKEAIFELLNAGQDASRLPFDESTVPQNVKDAVAAYLAWRAKWHGQ